MWSTLASNPTERTAFFNLLDEYFDKPTPSAPHHFHSLSPSSHTPSGVTPTPSKPSFSDRAHAATTSASTSIASSVLKNPTLSTAAFKQAGFSPSAAASASKFGASHSEVLAPHLANAGMGAAKAGWKNKESIGGAVVGGKPGRGPGAPPAGLVQQGKGFKTLMQIKGPMSKQDAKNNVFKEPLATKSTTAKVYSTPTTSHLPPPIRRGEVAAAEVEEGVGKAKAMYEYAGTAEDDLPLREGDIVTILEHVSADWLRCQNSQGQTGLVPTAYVQQL